jgi:hypothetical protein
VTLIFKMARLRKTLLLRNRCTKTHWYCRLALITLRELTMLDIMNSLTDKEGWEVKVSLIVYKLLGSSNAKVQK